MKRHILLILGVRTCAAAGLNNATLAAATPSSLSPRFRKLLTWS